MRMIRKPSIGLLTLLCFSQNCYVHSAKAMSNFTGLHSVAYVTVPTDEWISVKEACSMCQHNSKDYFCVRITFTICIFSEKLFQFSIHFRYEWKNEINEDNELLLMIKTRTDTVDALTKFVKENHPYEVCEVISLPIQNGNDQYLSWISDVVPPIDKREADEKKNL
uniref:Uncharacterized protein n=2 Tax=Apocrita TaxID=7400 RepID=A0ABD2W503_9HYME